MADEEKELDLTGEKAPIGVAKGAPAFVTKPFDSEESRETTRGDLARGLLYLLTFAIGGVLVFIGSGRLEGTVLTQSVFPSLIALAGTALGFYFGSQSNNSASSGGKGSDSPPGRSGLKSAQTPKEP
jgi:hypothetical protein